MVLLCRNLETIFTVNRQKYDTQHFGSRLTWLPDGTLLVSVGDGGNPPVELDGDLIRKQAQNLDAYLGKVVRLNDDGSVPTDNPFVDNSDAAPGVLELRSSQHSGHGLRPDSEPGVGV